jgi:uncharacterized protein (DUF952 family)
MIYIIAQKTDWDAAKQKGFFETPSLTDPDEGFIHCSKEEQVVGTASKYFHGQSGLVLLAIEPRQVKAETKYENTDGGTMLFPHVYGRIELAAISNIYAFPARAKAV